jgi:glutathione S-transferase
VLLRDDGPPLFDSTVICEYLDCLHGGPPFIPERGEARWLTLRLQALAQGMADAGVLARWESRRSPELQWPAWMEGQLQKVVGAYDLLEREMDFDPPVELGQIAVATSLSWLEFRDVGPSFREGRPRLAHWYDRFAARPSMRATPMRDDATP